MASPELGQSLGAERVLWVREWRRPDGGLFRVGRRGDHLVAEWEGFGTLRANRAGTSVEIVASDALDSASARKWREGPVRALLRHLHGRPTLHAASAAIDGRAFVFLGESGAGKSTCAAALCVHAGGELLADDLTDLEIRAGELMVTPTDADHWLTLESALALGQSAVGLRKDAVRAMRVRSLACPVAALVSLTFAEADAPLITPIRGQEAFETLNAGYVRFIVDDTSVHLRDLELMSNIVAAVPILRLARPRALGALDRVAAALEELSAGIVASEAP